jgi:hypothetical protein
MRDLLTSELEDIMQGRYTPKGYHARRIAGQSIERIRALQGALRQALNWRHLDTPRGLVDEWNGLAAPPFAQYDRPIASEEGKS